MPTYDYECKKCGLVFEAFNISYDLKNAPTECPECNGEIIKLMSAPAFDIIGYCYMNEYGKHAWKKHMNKHEKAEVLRGVKDPY